MIYDIKDYNFFEDRARLLGIKNLVASWSFFIEKCKSDLSRLYFE